MIGEDYERYRVLRWNYQMFKETLTSTFYRNCKDDESVYIESHPANYVAQVSLISLVLGFVA